MRRFLRNIRTLFITSWFPMTVQQSTFKNEFLKKWQNSLEYTLSVATQMPEDSYGYQPSHLMRSFGEQIVHIGMAITYLSQSALSLKHIDYKGDIQDKEAVITYLKQQYIKVSNAVVALPASDFEQTKVFWAGRMTRRKILNITFDHITHHRAQAIVYLRMQSIVPPTYISW